MKSVAMDPKSAGVWDTAYKLLMRRNSVYVAFIFVGAIVGERAVDYSFNKMWEKRNRGKLYEDIPGLGTKTAEAD